MQKLSLGVRSWFIKTIKYMQIGGKVTLPGSLSGGSGAVPESATAIIEVSTSYKQ